MKKEIDWKDKEWKGKKKEMKKFNKPRDERKSKKVKEESGNKIKE